jgi:hypothetical protein
MNILIGASDGYDWSKIKNWVLSSKCFGGKRVLLAYRMDFDTKEKCLEHGIEVVDVHHDIYGEPLNHDARMSVGAARTVSHEIRYFHAWQYLNDQTDVTYVVLTDTRDVIFQSDPIPFLFNRLHVVHPDFKSLQLLAPQEGILYQDEPWNADNLYKGYGGYIWEYMKTKPVYNCGTIAGVMPFFGDFVHTLWSMTTGKNTYPADQCSFGLLAETTLRELTYRCKHEEGWCCQCGVMADPHKSHMRQRWITPEPHMKDDGFVYTSDDILYCLVHQYERNPQWLKKIEERIGNG